MLIAHVERYLSLRQMLGYKLRDTSANLRAFAKFATRRGTSRNWWAFYWRTSPCNERRAFAFLAKGASNAAFLGRKLPPTSAPGWQCAERSPCPSCSSMLMRLR